jgi:hypothetical protein
MKDELAELLKSRPAGPFFFLGSGFSRRYVGLDDWRGLLSRFCQAGKPFEYYLAKADGSYPRSAALIAEDFNEYWWSADEYGLSVEANQNKITNATSALRIEISKYLMTLDQAKAKASPHANEVSLLAGLNVDGIVTTNWDLFIEQLFPDYKVYIGQKELLFSNPQQIGEIYKIHGSAAAPASLVLTHQDYTEFNARNAYLAAKLITIFVEHPIIFIGYSMSDDNITSLLRAISLCIGADKIGQLRNNLIFVQTLRDGEKPGISDTYLTIDGVQIPLVLVKTDDFVPIYESLSTLKRKIPARILRYCKEQLYELVKSAHPEEKLCVVNIDEIDRKEDVEFLVGVGVAKQELPQIGGVGYAPIDPTDLIHDLLHDDKKFDPQKLLESGISVIGRNTVNIPVFKYLREIGIDTEEKYRESGLHLDRWVDRDRNEFRLKSYSKSFRKKYRGKSVKEVIESCTAENASAYIPFFEPEQIDPDEVRAFLIANEDKMAYASSPYASYFRKLAALYDRLRWGWPLP